MGPLLMGVERLGLMEGLVAGATEPEDVSGVGVVGVVGLGLFVSAAEAGFAGEFAAAQEEVGVGAAVGFEFLERGEVAVPLAGHGGFLM